jgi:hypothetical protein
MSTDSTMPSDTVTPYVTTPASTTIPSDYCNASIAAAVEAATTAAKASCKTDITTESELLDACTTNQQIISDKFKSGFNIFNIVFGASFIFFALWLCILTGNYTRTLFSKDKKQNSTILCIYTILFSLIIIGAAVTQYYLPKIISDNGLVVEEEKVPILNIDGSTTFASVRLPLLVTYGTLGGILLIISIVLCLNTSKIQNNY